MKTQDIEQRITELDARIRSFGNNIGVSLMYWPNKWTVTAHFLDIKGVGDTPEDAFSAFDKALQNHENQSTNLAKTLGIQAA